MRVIVAMLAVVAVLEAGSARAAAPVEPGKVFAGPNGELVTAIPLTPADDKKAIVLVQGTDSELDGKVLPYDVETSGQDVRYVTQWHGRRYVTLYLLVSGSRRNYYVNVPGRRDDTAVTFDDARTRALKGEEVYALHQKQKSQGLLTRLMAFDRKGEEAQIERELATSVKSMNEACGSQTVGLVEWASIPDELIKEYSIASYCEAPLDSLRKLCASAEAKKVVQTRIKEASCRFGDAPAVKVESGRLTWTTAKDASNQEEFATKAFLDTLESTRGQGEKLSARMALEKTHVCSDGKGHYVLVRPDETHTVQLAYGDGERFVEVASPPWVLNGHFFLEPRFYNKTMNHSFRGLDMGLYSEVAVDEEKKTCAVRCGERTIPFTWVDGEQKETLVSKATFEPNPQKYVPYALLRDQKGRYYLVERGFKKEEERNFRVSIGPKGNLQVQKMKDVVSDSKGEIFSTKRGELRLVVEKEQPSLWIENKKKTELRPVPVEENMPLIYNELGVYTGARLGTPCDDQ
ncbi:hypothetical protein [Cystobacter fuscus]|uniref:hypothetical protein n=1 Tax=Cystobacter fuscus TaxID=43 RepID=UPI0037C0FD47